MTNLLEIDLLPFLLEFTLVYSYGSHHRLLPHHPHPVVQNRACNQPKEVGDCGAEAKYFNTDPDEAATIAPLTACAIIVYSQYSGLASSPDESLRDPRELQQTCAHDREQGLRLEHESTNANQERDAWHTKRKCDGLTGLSLARWDVFNDRNLYSRLLLCSEMSYEFSHFASSSLV
jgi:hypothetical protein